jgi:hypothetical protein
MIWPSNLCPETWGERIMEKQAKRLVLSKETLRSLDDQDLSGVVGGTLINVNTVVCDSGVCCSVICNSAVCNIDVTVAL